MLQAPGAAGGAASGAAAPACCAPEFTPNSELALVPAAPPGPCPATGAAAVVCGAPAPLLDIIPALTPDVILAGVAAELGAAPEGSPLYGFAW
jgi:hypothetical protein